jgi:Na+-translocating ferredoxin:NAD+ oxidoreductase RnfG subunit
VNETLKVIIILTLFSIGGGGIAVFFHSFLSPSIEARRADERRSAMERMFTAGVKIIEVYGKKPLPSCYWIGKKDSIVIGYAFPVETSGYSGTILSLVGIDTSGTIMGIKILSETGMPAQGMTIEDCIPRTTLWGRLFGKKDIAATWFIEQFKGTSVKKPFIIDTLSRRKAFFNAMKKERQEGNMISAVTGATVSTRAMIHAIQKNAASFLSAIKGHER